jgi:tellurium resistance protein TerZ
MISLKKGQKISLKKDNGDSLTKFCVGANWGMVETQSKGFFGIGGGTSKKAVDLDVSCGLFDKDKNLVEKIYYGNKNSRDGAIKHSGDDLTGDDGGDDGLDNEIITVDLTKIDSKVDQIVFVLNSFNKVPFDVVPYSHIRLYEGTPSRVENEVAKYNISAEPDFTNKISMVMGKLYRHNEEWKFSAIGRATSDTKLPQLLETVKQDFL